MTSMCMPVLQHPSKMPIIRTGKNFGRGRRREFACEGQVLFLDTGGAWPGG